MPTSSKFNLWGRFSNWSTTEDAYALVTASRTVAQIARCLSMVDLVREKRTDVRQRRTIRVAAEYLFMGCGIRVGFQDLSIISFLPPPSDECIMEVCPPTAVYRGFGPIKRRFPIDSSFFDDGNSERELFAKSWTHDTSAKSNVGRYMCADQT